MSKGCVVSKMSTASKHHLLFRPRRDVYWTSESSVGFSLLLASLCDAVQAESKKSCSLTCRDDALLLMCCSNDMTSFRVHIHRCFNLLRVHVRLLPLVGAVEQGKKNNYEFISYCNTLSLNEYWGLVKRLYFI